ncbi:hypothetical protein HNQ93_000048 [Hymenobacter luteus]|uniref:Uncharacterized protein n=2 Tax=Hymenobacter TaxID=89966 RepID=A0A7W9W9T6_9BACT|nr:MULTISPECIES: hypothetical protein [Hymenobacter]MBB4600472.1 hypothetical protein [Hymenobacter latericoloratus]MBB6057218.1 hypothetical protein [Hymenobacter luteus]
MSQTAGQRAESAASGKAVTGSAWLRFVERVEHGQLLDRLGQYVSKEVSGFASSGQRTMRPKLEPSQRRMSVVRGKNAPGTVWGTWEQPDLNDGSGGRFIASYQSKDVRDGGPIEVGVIAGNSSSISPPMGWIKIDNVNGYGVDLNEGAGGDYIYFCIKRR